MRTEHFKGKWILFRTLIIFAYIIILFKGYQMVVHASVYVYFSHYA